MHLEFSHGEKLVFHAHTDRAGVVRRIEAKVKVFAKSGQTFEFERDLTPEEISESTVDIASRDRAISKLFDEAFAKLREAQESVTIEVVEPAQDAPASEIPVN